MPSENARPTAHGLIADGVYTFALRIVNIAVALALGVLTARLLGPAGKGIYALPMVEAGLVSTGFAGLSSATSYYLLNASAGRRIVATATKASLLFVAAGAIAVIAIAWIGRAPWAALPAVVSLPAVAGVNLVTGYVVGIKRVRYATTLTVAGTVVTFACMAVALLAFSRTPWAAIAAWLASTTLVAVVAYAAVLIHARTLARGHRVPLGTYLKMALKVGATSLVSLLNYRADLYIVAVVLPPIDLGLYTVAISAAESLLVPTQVAALVTSPHIGGLESHAAARLAARCVRNNMLAALCLCVALFVAAPFLVKLLYGAAFLPLVPALRVLLIGVVALSLGSPVSNYYTLKLGKPEIPLVLAAASAAICIAGCIVMVPHLHIVGAALASTVAYIAGQGLGLGYFAYKTGISPATMLIPKLEDFAIYYRYARGVRSL